MVAEEDIYKEITRKIAEVYEAEKGRPSLYPLEETFYQDVKRLLNYLWDRYISSQESVKESSRAPLYLEEYRNLKRVLTQIYLRREKKIVRLAISAAMGGVVNTENMVPSEKRLFEELQRALRWHRKETLREYLSGMGPAPSVDTTTEEYMEEPILPRPQPSPVSEVEPEGAEKVAVMESEEKRAEAGVENEHPAAVSVSEAGEAVPEGESRGEVEEGVGRTDTGALMTGITEGSAEGGVEAVKRPLKRGELFGTREVLFVEKEVGDIATPRERSLYLRSGDVIYIDREIMEALSRGGFGRLVTTDD